MEKGYDAVSLDDIVNHAGGSKPLFINTSVIKMAYLLQSAIIAVKCFKDICIAFQPEQTSLKDYLIQTLIRFINTLFNLNTLPFYVWLLNKLNVMQL